MRVLLINSVCGRGSTGKICTDIAEVLTERGHEVKIAYGRGVVLEQYKKYAVRVGTEFDVKAHWLLTRLFDMHGLGSRMATLKFIRYIKEFNPDIIHLHNIHGYYINIKLLFEFLKAFHKPVIWTLHDCWAFTGHCSHFDLIKCNKWEAGCYKCPLKKEYPASRVMDRSRYNYNLKKKLFGEIDDLTIVTPSKWLANLVERSFLGKYKTEVIPNGISTDAFKYRESDFKNRYGIEGKKTILGVAGIWSRSKGLEDIIKLSAIVDDGYVCVVVGKIPNKEKYDLSRVIHIDHIDNAIELAEIYSSADFFFNPTMEETYSMVNLEAYTAGTPVITYRTGGSPETLLYGAIVNQGDYNGAYEWIKQHRNYGRNENIDYKLIDRKKMSDSYYSLIVKNIGKP